MKNFETEDKSVIFVKFLKGAGFNVEESSLSDFLLSVVEVHGDKKAFVFELGVRPDLKHRIIFTVIETLNKMSLCSNLTHPQLTSLSSGSQQWMSRLNSVSIFLKQDGARGVYD